MGQELKAFTALSEDLSSDVSTHIRWLPIALARRTHILPCSLRTHTHTHTHVWLDLVQYCSDLEPLGSDWITRALTSWVGQITSGFIAE